MKEIVEFQILKNQLQTKKFELKMKKLNKKWKS